MAMPLNFLIKSVPSRIQLTLIKVLLGKIPLTAREHFLHNLPTISLRSVSQSEFDHSF